MELIEARALKSSFLSDMAMKTSQQVFLEDIWCVTGINNVPSDDFSVDDLLDFSDKDFKDGQSLQELHEDDEKDSFSGSSQHRNSQVSNFSCMDSFSGELPVPVDELENLEWLSQFVDDSTSEFSLLCPAGSFKDKTGGFQVSRSEPVIRPVVQKMRVPRFPLPVVQKPRTKRSRPAGRKWSFASPTVSADSCSPTSSSYGSSPFPSVLYTNPVLDGDLFCSVEKPPLKKPKKISAAETGSGRRCTHCQVQKTPQWRAGPLGPKTLCNACGVRYKSGRLFPEYRPACSPTFSQEVHSNSHRKVLEMRRKKESGDVVDSGLATMISTC
ncbi:PREDICTED: GATA transcription factor 5-like [Nicotiana attenuata]|uniref:GATA transcription factor n=1 Tax=Nicotiana attenuata TaxID=49451 RepID=A0A1J6IQG5_NICAT|nr:PREDICTED: GATA transcription factor 5-like [Nicotiana attenuata]OIT07086.1 gata transcription factor 5 [Nicotiana attenuata]